MGVSSLAVMGNSLLLQHTRMPSQSLLPRLQPEGGGRSQKVVKRQFEADKEV